MKKRFILALMAAFLLCAGIFITTRKEATPVMEDGLVFNWYSAPTAVVGECLYEEITVEVVKSEYYINVYSGDRNALTSTQKTYKSEPALITELMKIVDKYALTKQSDERAQPIDGRINVIKFLDNEGTMIRISSDNMPKNGDKAFNEVRKVLMEYLAIAEEINA